MKWLKKAEERAGLIHALESTLATIVSYYLCYYVSSLYNFPYLSISGLWGVISAFMVLGAIHQDVKTAAIERILATTIAAIISLILLYSLGYTMLSLAIAIFCAVILISLIKQRKAYRSTCITVAVIYVIGFSSPIYIPPWIDCLTRLFESFIGVSVACATVYLFHPIRHRIG